MAGLFFGGSLLAEDSEKYEEGSKFHKICMDANGDFQNENFEVKDEEGRVRPGTRLMAHSEWVKFEEERFKEDDTTEELNVSLSASPFKAVSRDALIENVNSTHRGAFQAPINVSALGGLVELRDRSVWIIADEDRYKTLNWLPTDTIFITPNHEWFPSHQFCMTNHNTGVSVKCSLKFGPLSNGAFTHSIKNLNYYTQEIELKDGSLWEVCGLDSKYFSKWENNANVIIGINDGFLRSRKPNILINVQTLTFVRVICTSLKK